MTTEDNEQYYAYTQEECFAENYHAMHMASPGLSTQHEFQGFDNRESHESMVLRPGSQPVQSLMEAQQE